MPQKAMIGGKAVTVQIAPSNQKAVTIVSSASGNIQKTISASDLQSGGHKVSCIIGTIYQMLMQ